MTDVRPKVESDGRYTVTDARKALGISHRAMYDWINKGWIKCEYRKVGCRRFILGSEILRVWTTFIDRVGFHPSFSRHGITRASSVLLIWLNENVRHVRSRRQ